MIESFSVSNFGCFKNQVTFQLSPYKIRVKPNHISDNDCLKTSVIFGGNATGKTTMIRALSFLKNMVTVPGYTTEEPIANWYLNNPFTSFDLAVNVGNKHYEYHLVVESKKSRYSPEIFNEYDDLVFRTKHTEPEVRLRYSYSIVKESLKVGGLECDRYGNRHLDVVFDTNSNSSEKDDHMKEKIEVDRLQSKLNQIEREMVMTEASIGNLKSKIAKYEEIIAQMNAKEQESGGISDDSLESELKKLLSEREKTLCLIDDFTRKLEYQKALLDREESIQEKISIGSVDEFESKIKHYSSEAAELERQIGKISAKIGDNKAFETRKADFNAAVLQFKRELEELTEKRDNLLRESDIILSKIAELRSSFDFENTIDLSKDSVLISKVVQVKNGVVERIRRPELDELRQWFSSSLIILGTDDFHIPLNDEHILSKLSKILESFDVGIQSLSWISVDDPSHEREINLVRGLISDKDARRLALCKEDSISNQCLSSIIIKANSGLYLFKYWIGEESVYKLFAYHDHNKSEPIDLGSESDGTRRMIELASILFPTDKDRVYVVDELDRRLHPNLTLRFINLFFEDSSEHKQLLFTTHEVGLMTTDLFRMDEIWFTEAGDDGSSLISLIDLPADSESRIKFNKRLDKMYLEGSFGGIPKIDRGSIQPLDG